jgi:hypothetical protein
MSKISVIDPIGVFRVASATDFWAPNGQRRGLGVLTNSCNLQCFESEAGLLGHDPLNPPEPAFEGVDQFL